MATSPYQRVHDWVWAREPASPVKRRALHVGRYALAMLRDLMEGEISLRAMSLVYTTLLSLVPLLALAFSILKALGVHNSLEPLLLQVLAPLGEQAKVIADNIIGFVNNIKVGVLGSIGVGMLLYTAVSMISKVEASFNYIWRITQTRGATQRFGQYLSVLIVGPVLIFSALGLTASVRSSSIVTRLQQIEPFGTTLLVLTELAPYALIVGAFTFMYAFIPNTRVRLAAAAGGGLFAGVAWESASVGFARFVGGAGSYSAIYSGFAIVIVLLIWLYLGWLIVLFGCRLSFYIQHPRYLSGFVEPAPPGSREAEFLALRLMMLIVSRFQGGQQPLGVEDAQRAFAVDAMRLERTVSELVRNGVLAIAEPGRQLVPARDPASYTLAQLWRWSRGPVPQVRSDQFQDRRAWDLLDGLEVEAAPAAAMTLADWLRLPQAGSS